MPEGIGEGGEPDAPLFVFFKRVAVYCGVSVGRTPLREANRSAKKLGRCTVAP